ncbi:ATP-binding cassette domain-containing protein [Thalassotalea sp. PS06]|uniref:ABC transporter ATP-binding protein n=1 Tax=Thalassotalea sp. PS06 TaxID=2594005 RepID=UPI0011653B17|nr:ABC transporter ATP-binding protein [Thalassotalea sp. PS06]QDP01459.1 ABC transporter ATP-binding protein [Thalassotalea sp. PS06]
MSEIRKDSKELVIKARGLGKDFGSLKAIQNLDLDIERGKIYGFLGPNGCGKTTSIRMLTGLLIPTYGEVDVLGLQLPEEANRLRYHIGYMTQVFSMYRDLTVLENLSFIAKVYGIHGARQKQRIDELLEIYNLDSLANQFAGSMSGGQRQRMALAAAVLHKPDLLFLDEPTSAVDPESRRDFWEQLFDLSESGTSILVSTHYMDEAERCHGLAILEAGIKRADGSPESLMQGMDANVVEVESTRIRQLKNKLLTVDAIISAAQLGTRLRVLIDKSVVDPTTYLAEYLTSDEVASLASVRPSLEDVFVTCTGEGRQ